MSQALAVVEVTSDANDSGDNEEHKCRYRDGREELPGHEDTAIDCIAVADG